MALILFYLFEILVVLGIVAYVFMQGYIIFRGAPYMPSTNHRADIMIKALNLKPGDKAADLGSGNGLLLIEMAKRGIIAHGYEINPMLVLLAKWNIRKAGLKNKAFVHWGDIWSIDLSRYNGLTVYLLPHIMKKLETKLQNELKPGTKVVVETWKLPTKKPEKTVEDYVFVYKF